MKSRLMILLAACLIIAACGGPGPGAEVAQGKCISYDKEKHVLVMQEYDAKITKQNKYGNPTDKQSTFNLSKAEIGITPQPADIIRLSYTKEGNELMGVKVMNVTKQDIMKR